MISPFYAPQTRWIGSCEGHRTPLSRRCWVDRTGRQLPKRRTRVWLLASGDNVRQWGPQQGPQASLRHRPHVQHIVQGNKGTGLNASQRLLLSLCQPMGERKWSAVKGGGGRTSTTGECAFTDVDDRVHATKKINTDNRERQTSNNRIGELLHEDLSGTHEPPPIHPFHPFFPFSPRLPLFPLPLPSSQPTPTQQTHHTANTPYTSNTPNIRRIEQRTFASNGRSRTAEADRDRMYSPM